ncbi:MAG: hypothetical protein QXD03_05465 [Candidatus Anstonellales archaeon]
MAKFIIAAIMTLSPLPLHSDTINNITVYHYHKTNDNPISYNGSTPIKLRTAAVSHDLKYMINKTAVINYDDGMRIKVLITDLMDKKHKKSVDVYVENISLAVKMGKRKGKIEMLKGGNFE